MKNMLCLLLAVLSIGALNAQTTEFRHIPADAGQVYAIHVASLIGKVDILSLMKMAQTMKFDKDNPMSYLADFSKTGIDLRQDLLVAVKTSDNPDSASFITIIAHLADSGKFVTFLRENDKKMDIIHAPGKARLAVGNKQAVAWSDKLAIIVIVKRAKGQTADALTMAKDRKTASHRSIAALEGSDRSFYATDEKFTKGFSDDADIHIWNKGSTGFGVLSKLMQMTPAAASPHAGDLSQFIQKAAKANTLSTMRFESGKLVFQTTRFLSSDDSAIAARTLAGPIGDKLLTTLPPGKILGLFAMHFDLSASMANLRKYGMSANLDSLLSTKGLTTQDMFHAFSGDLLFVANVPDTGKTPLMYGAVGIGDKASFDKFAALLKPAAPAPGDTTPPKKQHIFLSTRNDIAVLSGSQQHSDAWFSPAGNAPTSRFTTSDMRSNAFFFAIDFQVGADLLAKVLTKADTIAAKDQKLLDIVRKFDSFVATAPSGQQGTTQITYELNFTDRNKNGLASFMEIASELAKTKGHQ
jgi:hypothetical protein